MVCVFSGDSQYPGSGAPSEHGYSLRCVLKKQAQEYQFLMDQKMSDSLLKNWLGDAQEKFFADIKKLKDDDKIFEGLSRQLKRLDVTIRFSDLDFGNFSIGEDVFPIDRDCHFGNQVCEKYVSEFNIKKRDTQKNIIINRGFIFSKSEIEILMSMEECITEEFTKILNLKINDPYIIKKIIEGHLMWMNYREALLSMYINFKIPPTIIKLRFICLNLSRVYFYRKYYNFFSQNNHTAKCVHGEPIEYGWMYDCASIVRGPLGLALKPPCFSE